MIKSFRCRHCGTVFNKYLAPFEEFKVVECIECNEAAELVSQAASEPGWLGSSQSGWFFFEPVRVPVR